MENDDYDEILWVDWDCYPLKEMPDNYWDIMGKKESFQANLMTYHHRQCWWRKHASRTVPNGGFIYLRDRAIVSRVMSIYDSYKGINDEPAWARYIDDFIGDWGNLQASYKKYWDMFEPELCCVYKASPFSEELLKSRDVCFRHVFG